MEEASRQIPCGGVSTSGDADDMNDPRVAEPGKMKDGDENDPHGVELKLPLLPKWMPNGESLLSYEDPTNVARGFARVGEVESGGPV